jgi:glycosyltransferase involved in cell wall biosynthesis
MSLGGGLKERLIPARYQHRVYPLRQALTAVNGLPDVLDKGLLENVVQKAFDAPLRGARYVELPGYKRDSAYRLFLHLGVGRLRTVILKNVALTDDAYPAIKGFPGQPGWPEWDVLSGDPGPLAPVLPIVYAAEEMSEGLKYQFLLEDLAWHHRPILDERDVESAIRALPLLHDRLAKWAESAKRTPRVRHDLETGPSFLAFVKEALADFHAWHPTPEVARMLEGWAKVEAAYLETDAVSKVTSQWIHGDFNRKNIFLNVEGSEAKLVDWEWMGYGPPHLDLASVLKRSPGGIQRAAVRSFFAEDDRLSHDQNWRIFLWARLARSLLDAALHARQNTAGIGHTADHVGAHLEWGFEVLAAMEGTTKWRPTAERKIDSTAFDDSKRGADALGSPRVTVALPVYNGERFLREVIDSILLQTFTDFELLISDNASTDTTQSIAEEFAARDPRIQYRRHESNVGAHYNYNGLVAEARGEYLKWAADDDLYDPDFLRRCVEILDEFPDVVLAHTQACDIGENGEFLDDRPFGFDITADSPVARFRTYLGAGNACLPIFGLHRTSVLRRTGLLGHYAGSDRVLLAELALNGKFREVPEPMFLHREHPGRSMRRFPNPRDRGAWFDPKRSGPDLVFWKVLIGYIAAIRRAQLRTVERFRLLLMMGKWTLLKGPDLTLDLVTVLTAKARSLWKTRS